MNTTTPPSLSPSLPQSLRPFLRRSVAPSLILLAAITTGCQNRQSTLQAPADTNQPPLAAAAPETPPAAAPDASIPTPKPVTADTPAPRNTDTPAPAGPTAPTPVAIAPDQARTDAPGQPKPSGAPASGLPSAATGPTAPATAPVTTGPVERTPRSYVAADADDATLLRNFPLSVNTYPSGHAIAGPVYRINAPPPRSNKPSDVYVQDLFQTILTPIQMAATPVWMFITPPWKPVEYHGEQFPPSYTVNDPLPYYVDEKVPGTVQMKRTR